MTFWLVVSCGVLIATGLAIVFNLFRGEEAGSDNVLFFGFSAALFAWLMGWLG